MCETYCVKQKKKTRSVPNSIKIVTTKNGRLMEKSLCLECGAKKSSFVAAQKGKGIDIHKAILKVAPKKGFVLPGHKYTGPGNPLEKQVKWDLNTGEILQIYQHPTGRTDAVSMQHDVDYSVCGNDLKCKHKADKKMVKSLDAIPKKDRQWGHALARNMIKAKHKTGMGVKQKKPKNVKSRRVKK